MQKKNKKLSGPKKFKKNVVVKYGPEIFLQLPGVFSLLANYFQSKSSYFSGNLSRAYTTWSSWRVLKKSGNSIIFTKQLRRFHGGLC